MAPLFIFLFVLLAVEKSVGPLSPNCMHFPPIYCVGSANVPNQNVSVPQSPKQKISAGHQLLANGQFSLSKKSESQRKVSVNSSQQIVSDEQKLSSSELEKVQGAFLEFSVPVEKHQNSLGQYLAELSKYYHSARLHVPPSTIARVLLGMKNEMDFHRIKTKATELPYPLTLENFRVEKQSSDSNGMGGNIRITFIDECRICSQNELTMSKLITMSPQQISEMRLNSDKSDIAWFLGSVIHLLAFQTYPLEEWHIRNKTLSNQCQLDGTFKMPQNSESFCMFLLQNSVNKMLFSAEKLQIRTDFPRGFEKQYAILGQIMRNALHADSEKRTFDRNGQLLKLAAGLTV
ncbi:hypothetical protein niasHS_001102 [Heterodera schachtii]|uniref:Uncharacterized protein n=1 Tax=Heterodera schachtii TaxID=97005 RepID=A0ABD2KCD3_HETSC